MSKRAFILNKLKILDLFPGFRALVVSLVIFLILYTSLSAILFLFYSTEFSHFTSFMELLFGLFLLMSAIGFSYGLLSAFSVKKKILPLVFGLISGILITGINFITLSFIVLKDVIQINTQLTFSPSANMPYKGIKQIISNLSFVYSSNENHQTVLIGIGVLSLILTSLPVLIISKAFFSGMLKHYYLFCNHIEPFYGK